MLAELISIQRDEIEAHYFILHIKRKNKTLNIGFYFVITNLL